MSVAWYTDWRIIHISFSSNGGAGRVASLLCSWQRMNGIQSDLLTLTDQNLVAVAWRRPWLFVSGLCDYLLVRARGNLSLFTLFRHGFHRLPRVLESEKVLLHLHWYPGVISERRLQRFAKKQIPLIITLHDMYPITGGCHFSNGCTNYREGCQHCPQVRSIFKKCVAKRFRKKQKTLEGVENLRLTTPGNWLYQEANEILGSREKRVTLIGNPIDRNIFKPKHNSVVRQRFGIRPGELVLGCVASDISDSRKGIAKIIEGWKILNSTRNQDDRIWLVVIGGGSPTWIDLNSDRLLRIEHISCVDELVSTYSIIDVFCTLATAETHPNVLNEFASMGIPAIVSDIPGHKYAVENFALPANNIKEFVNQFLKIESNPILVKQLSRAALAYSEKFDLDIVCNELLREYMELIEYQKSRSE